jgi:hypothetical protein
MPALFPRPTPERPQLSARYAHPPWLAGHGDTVRWTRQAATGRADCDECAALQHETRGEFWPRRQVRARRVVNTNPATALRLCGAHTAAWKDRDTTAGAS